ncbi:MAG: DEAD/DEAH box helicase, partial [Acidimicrobiales bacterium]
TRLRRRSRPTSRPEPNAPAQPPAPDAGPGELRPWQWAAIAAAKERAAANGNGTEERPVSEPAGEVTDPV